MTGQDSREFEKITTVEQLVALVDFLRSEQGCPWDRRQTSESLKPYLLEELYELLDAIEQGDEAKLNDELGDVLLHLCFQVSLAREAGNFGMEDVVAGIRDKMIRRHPHVFGEEQFASREDQLFAWEQIKHREKQNGAEDEQNKSVLDGLPRSLPALLRAFRIQGRVSKFQFDWDGPEELFGKLDEEIAELKEAMAAGDQAAVEEELGDLLFTAVNLGRLLNLHPHEALERTNEKFIRRFKAMEGLLVQRGLRLGELNLEQLDKFWEQVKDTERGGELNA
ncbi:MAG: nucleoside triphosphate pyrophosphohydrolase [Candidatus Glassbacteria bacterium]|nr:nucleoside triphosphate pyrophosphohydrolase [Candidatus Glassbacteria bacterium]